MNDGKNTKAESWGLFTGLVLGIALVGWPMWAWIARVFRGWMG